MISVLMPKGDRPPFIINLPCDENGLPIFGGLSDPLLSEAQKSYSLGLWAKMPEVSHVLPPNWDGILKPENKNLWNQAIAELNFPDEVVLP